MGAQPLTKDDLINILNFIKETPPNQRPYTKLLQAELKQEVAKVLSLLATQKLAAVLPPISMEYVNRVKNIATFTKQHKPVTQEDYDHAEAVSTAAAIMLHVIVMALTDEQKQAIHSDHAYEQGLDLLKQHTELNIFTAQLNELPQLATKAQTHQLRQSYGSK